MFRQVGSPLPTWGWCSVPFPARRIWKRACEATKRAKNGLLWFLPFFENYLPSRKVSRLIAIWKGGIHAKFQLLNFKDGREKITEDPTYYLQKSPSWSRSERFSRPPPPSKKCVARTREQVRRKKTLGPFGPQSLFSSQVGRLRELRKGLSPIWWIPGNDPTPMAWHMTNGRLVEWEWGLRE